MANQIFANKREVACKAGGGKTICAMPDVCMTPPETPATPPGIPVPYPNTGFASDTTDGSKTVHISGKEVMLKNKSFFKTSTGDEAGCATKKGVISSTNKGKVYFVAWSMNVKIEGENVVRHLDMTTNNHGSPTANESIPWPFIETMYGRDKKAINDACTKEKKRENDACKDYKSKQNPEGIDICEELSLGDSTTHKGTRTLRARRVSENKCAAARRCRLMKFDAERDGIEGCCPAQTPDHIIPVSSFHARSTKGNKLTHWSAYEAGDAPCMCSEGGNASGTHGLRHACHKSTAGRKIKPGMRRSFKKEMKHCARSMRKVAPHCSQRCIEAQLIRGHEDMGDLDQNVKFSPCGKPDMSEYKDLIARIKAASYKFFRAVE